MAPVLDHTIVPSRDRHRGAAFFGSIFGVPVDASGGHFVQVQVNETLTLDFADRSGFEPHHLAFHVEEEDFDAILARLEEAGVRYGSGPASLDDGRLNHRNGGRGLYFRDPDGHVLEILTRT